MTPLLRTLRTKITFSRLFSFAVILYVAVAISMPQNPQEAQNSLSVHRMSLENRHADKWVNNVFKDNILLNTYYLRGEQKSREANWVKVRKPFTYSFTLQPNEVFAYHDNVLDRYNDAVVKTTNARFNAQEGFRHSGFLFGDGVCHLASLLYWVSKDAGLEAVAPTNHNFTHIAEIPKEYGVSIYYLPGARGANAAQNLYIRNTKSIPVSFILSYDGANLSASVIEEDRQALAFLK